MPRRSTPTPGVAAVSARDAGRLLLSAQGLLTDPAAVGPATPGRVAKLVERLGFVQVDTISTVERAHHLILAARIAGYAPALLAKALERHRLLFEHWTHDASIIPVGWYRHWNHRFDRYRAGRWHRKQLGPDADRVLADVLERVSREGPLASSDFTPEPGSPGAGKTTWWDWRPHKVALDYLWRTGTLHVVARRSFQKVYDLTDRAAAAHAAKARPTDAEHVEWACRTALERLGTATAREVAQFWNAIPVTMAAAWLAKAAADGEVVRVTVESADAAPPKPAFALPGLAARIKRLPDPPAGMRLLCPFDPVLRDRARAKRLFGFDFRFEGFVPAAQRLHGYYVMAILDGDRFVGKADPKFDRAAGLLRVRQVWWEPGVKVPRGQAKAFEGAVERLAGWIGATRVEIAG